MSPLDTPWDVSLDELNNCLRAAGVEPVSSHRGNVSARDLDMSTRIAKAEALRQIVRQARADAPPVQDWLAASESLVLNDDGSQTARRKADAFWQSLSQIVYSSLALAMLGNSSELPLFIEMLRHQPAGHLTEMADDVLRRYVDPSRELDTPRLIQRAEEFLSTKDTKGHEEF